MQRVIVGELTSNQLAVKNPSYKDGNEDTAQGHDEFGCEKIEELEESHAKNPNIFP